MTLHITLTKMVDGLKCPRCGHKIEHRAIDTVGNTLRIVCESCNASVVMAEMQVGE